MISIRSLYLYLILIFMVSGCEDMFVQDIDITPTDFPPKLSVTAVLDTDSGRFSLAVYESRSLASFKDWRPVAETIVRDGEIRLFEDDTQILAIPGPFDLSFRSDAPGSGIEFCDGYRYYDTGISTKAGSTYRLEIDIDGYDPVSATTIMPDAPITGEVKPDTTQEFYKEKIWSRWGSGNAFYYKIELPITDNTNQPDYYCLEIIVYSNMESNQEYNGSIFPKYNDKVGINDFNLIQDNPEYLEYSDRFKPELCEMYEFVRPVISDQTFAGSQINLNLYVNTSVYPGKFRYPIPSPDYNPETDGPEIKYKHRHDLLVRHLSQGTYKHYKNMVVQRLGIDFLTEPANIPGNIKGGYGHFSALNTKRTTLSEYEYYSYPEKGYNPDSYATVE